MKMPMTHEGMHPTWCDRWNPYKARATNTTDLDEYTFNKLVGWRHEEYIDPTLLTCYCLDAPEFIPAGSTLCVKTIGGWEREEYNRIYREATDWKAEAKATYEVAQMLKKILEENES